MALKAEEEKSEAIAVGVVTGGTSPTRSRPLVSVIEHEDGEVAVRVDRRVRITPKDKLRS